MIDNSVFNWLFDPLIPIVGYPGVWSWHFLAESPLDGLKPGRPSLKSMSI